MTFEMLLHDMIVMKTFFDQTTGNTLSWVFAMCSQNTSVEARMAAECQSVMAKYNGGLTWEALGELTYVTAVIQETLRLRPTAPMVASRHCLQDDCVPVHDGKPVVLLKVRYFISIYVLCCSCYAFKVNHVTYL
jgi:hypothetical protein